jgi:hypothetical protein
MAVYEFVIDTDEVQSLPTDNPIRQQVEARGPIYVEAPYPIGEAPSVGESSIVTVMNDETGEEFLVRVRRIFSRPNFCIKGQSLVPWKHGETLATEVNGQTMRLQFQDHPHTSPEYQTGLEKMMRSSGIQGLGNTRFSEKHGCHVVDVASNVEDPLGVLEASKRRGDYSQSVMPVNSPYH